MDILEKDLREISRRLMTEKGDYYKDTRKYLNSIMKSAKQEDLMGVLAKLDYHELKYCISAGVPGHAMHAANEVLAIRKEELRKFEAGQVGRIRVEYEDKTVDEELDGESHSQMQDGYGEPHTDEE